MQYNSYSSPTAEEAFPSALLQEWPLGLELEKPPPFRSPSAMTVPALLYYQMMLKEVPVSKQKPSITLKILISFCDPKVKEKVYQALKICMLSCILYWRAPDYQRASFHPVLLLSNYICNTITSYQERDWHTTTRTLGLQQQFKVQATGFCPRVRTEYKDQDKLREKQISESK